MLRVGVEEGKIVLSKESLARAKYTDLILISEKS